MRALKTILVLDAVLLEFQGCQMVSCMSAGARGDVENTLLRGAVVGMLF